MEILIVKYINTLGSSWINPLTNFFCNEIFLIILWASIAGLILFFDKTNGKKIFLMLLMSITLHFIISEGIIKHLLSDFLFRTRPYIFDHSITPIGKHYTDSSFPSSHMASTLAIVSICFYYYKKYRSAIIIFVFFMAYSRIHNGMHHPSDVLAGSIFGILYGIMAIQTISRINFVVKLKA